MWRMEKTANYIRNASFSESCSHSLGSARNSNLHLKTALQEARFMLLRREKLWLLPTWRAAQNFGKCVTGQHTKRRHVSMQICGLPFAQQHPTSYSSSSRAMQIVVKLSPNCAISVDFVQPRFHPKNDLRRVRSSITRRAQFSPEEFSPLHRLI